VNPKIQSKLPGLALAFILILTACAPQVAPTSAPVQPTGTTTAPPPTETSRPQASPTSPPTDTQEPTAEPIVLTDGLGRTITLESPAQRIVSMAPSITESLYAIGAGSQVAGRDEFSNYPPEVTDLPNIGGFFSDFNFEAIVELEPDLVLAAEINTPEQVQTLEDLGLTVFLLANPTTIEEMYDSLRTLAQLTEHQQETESLIESLQARVAAVEDKVSEADSQPKIFYEIDSTDPNKPYTAGPGTFITQLIEDAGGENIAADLEDSYPQVSIEELLVRDPDIILLGDAAYGATAEAVAGRTGWEGLSAVQNGKIYPFNDDLVSRPGPRLVDGLEQLAKILHPELFE
jgi:iron complex transport system substrate-binding protein